MKGRIGAHLVRVVESHVVNDDILRSQVHGRHWVAGRDIGGSHLAKAASSQSCKTHHTRPHRRYLGDTSGKLLRKNVFVSKAVQLAAADVLHNGLRLLQLGVVRDFNCLTQE